jgi:hypothetical protein
MEATSKAVPNPTDKKRRPVDAWFWELFVQACGTKCCACGKTSVKLERGHIVPHAVGGTTSLDNLLPVCEPCNRQYRKKQTPDNRPPGWCERFFLLLGAHLEPRFLRLHENSSGYLTPASNHADSKQLIDWHSGDLGAANALFTQSSNMTRPDAEGLVEELVSASQKSNLTPPRLPFKQRQTEMVGLAMRRGREVFWQSGLAFFRDAPWMPNVDGYDIERDSWRSFAEHFYIYEEKWRDHVAAEAKQRERDAARQAQQRVEVRESRWLRYLLAAKCTPWPSMTDAERAFVARVEAEKDAPVRDISDEELARANAAMGREFAAKKKRLTIHLDLCDKIIRVGQLVGESTDHLRDCLLACRTVSELHSLHEPIQTYYRELMCSIDPASPDAAALFLETS